MNLISSSSTIVTKLLAFLAKLTQVWLSTVIAIIICYRERIAQFKTTKIIIQTRVRLVQWPLVMRVHHDVTSQALLATVGPRVSTVPCPVANVTAKLTPDPTLSLIRCFLDVKHNFNNTI